MRRPGIWALGMLLMGLATAQASIMAIDLGSEYLKVSLIKPGRTPIAIVVNEMSKRKTPALVGFANGERLLGEEASSFSVRYPETIVARAQDLLGKSADDPTIGRMLKDYGLPYKVVPHPTRNVAAVEIKEGVIISAEELVGSALQYARSIAEAQSGAPVPDAVIAVPAYFGQAQRQALVDAANLVGINVMGLINTHTAAALQFGIERDFANKTQNVILYDMGSGSTLVSLVRYSSYNIKEAGKPKPISQLEVKDVDWDADLGANQLDALLGEHFAKAFADKHKLQVDDVLGNPKSMAKLKKQVRRTKEILSANSGAPISVEEFHDNRDYQSHITREDFEKLAGSFFERAAAPLKRVLERSGLKPEEIDYVELLGGGTRVPRLQAALQEVLGGRALDRHLDADEAVVLGASLFAANLSTSFRLRKFGMADLSMYGVALKIEEVHEAERTEGEVPDLEGQGAEKTRNLLPYRKKLPIKRVVHFANLTADPIRLSLAYNTSTPHALPPGAADAHMAQFNITGVETAIKRYNTSGTVNIKFEAGYDGILKLAKAEAVVQYVAMEEKIITVMEEVNATTNGTDSNSTESAGASAESAKADADSATDKSDDSNDDNDKDDDESEDVKGEKGEGEGSEKGEGEEEVVVKADAGNATANATANGTANATVSPTARPVVKRIQVPRNKTAKVALNVTTAWPFPYLSADADALAASRKLIAGWVAAETAKRETAAAKNELEAYIIKMKEVLEGGDEKVEKVTTEEQRTAFLAQLNGAEDWLYDEGEAEAAPVFKAKLKELQDVGGRITRRAEESDLRPQVVAVARRELELRRAAVKLWEGDRPWVTEEERKSVEEKLDAFDTWLAAREKEQEGKAAHEDPAFYAGEVDKEWEKAEKVYNRINHKKKPKPPPAPPAAPDANATDAGNSTESGAGAKAEGEQQQQGAEGGADGKQGEAGADKKEDAKSDKGDTKSEAKKEESTKKGDKKEGKKEEAKGSSKDKKDSSSKDPKDSKKGGKKGGDKQKVKRGAAQGSTDAEL
mmetsp:Transcript_27424/g.69745  ORF Transcript_27424/g.69745 Transcript_27424/m.69745 type:complete len:1029 (-) Transcript_27424:524-3610(-)